jgi:hypothetical protein
MASEISTIPSLPVLALIAQRLGEGASVGEISRNPKVGMSENEIIQALGTDDFKEIMKERAAIAQVIIQTRVLNLLDRAVTTIGEVLETGGDRERLTAAKTLLDINASLAKPALSEPKKRKPRSVSIQDTPLDSIEKAFFNM